eukprot:gene10100-biopygen15300
MKTHGGSEPCTILSIRRLIRIRYDPVGPLRITMSVPRGWAHVQSEVVHAGSCPPIPKVLVIPDCVPEARRRIPGASGCAPECVPGAGDRTAKGNRSRMQEQDRCAQFTANAPASRKRCERAGAAAAPEFSTSVKGIPFPEEQYSVGRTEHRFASCDRQGGETQDGVSCRGHYDDSGSWHALGGARSDAPRPRRCMCARIHPARQRELRPIFFEKVLASGSEAQVWHLNVHYSRSLTDLAVFFAGSAERGRCLGGSR